MTTEVDRRTFIKGACVAGTAAVGSSALPNGPVGQSRAALPLIPIGIAAGGAAVGYLASEAADAYLGDSRDYSNYTGADALHTETYAGTLELQSADERVLTSVNNNITNSKNIALAKGKAAAIEAMNNEEGESAANTAMSDAIDQYYATIQQNLLNHHNAQVSQIHHMLESVANHSNLSLSTVFYSGGSYDLVNYNAIQTANVTLADGSTSEYDYFVWNWDTSTSGTSYRSIDPLQQNTDGYANNAFHTRDPASSDSAAVLNQFIADGTTDPNENGGPWNRALHERDDVNANLSGFISDVYNYYEPGDIPTEDLVDPITAATELRQNYDGYQTQGAHAAMLGIPTNATQTVHMTVHHTDGDYDVWADLFTEHVPTDSNGNEIGFRSGTTYSPSGWSEPLYIAYEYTEESTTTSTDTNTTSTSTSTSTDGETSTDFTQIESDFTINTIENSDGEQIDGFSPESRNNQTSDVTQLEEELAQIREAQLEMQEEAQSGGGGIDLSAFSIGGIPGAGVLLAAGGGLLLLLERDN